MFKAVFGATITIAAWFSWQAASGLWIYWRLDRTASCFMQKWAVKEISSSEYALKSSYRFKAGEKEWSGRTILKKPHHLNRAAAEKAVLEKKREPQTVWYCRSNPRVNSLQKTLPYKECFHALVALGVLGYFFVLHRYAENFSKSA